MRLLLFLTAFAMWAAEHRGVVSFHGTGVPGATVVATRGDQRRTTISDAEGAYAFADLAPGAWTVSVEMQLLETQRREITVSADAPPTTWALRLGPLATAPAATVSTFRPAEVKATGTKQNDSPQTAAPAPDAELAARAADGFLINGSVNNGATSPFALMPAFGNNRRTQRSRYNGNLGFMWNNAAFDARAFSLTGQNTPKPAFNRFQGLFALGGPIRIPGWINRNGPVFTLNYQWTRNSEGSTQSGLMPTESERAGILTRPATDPLSGTPFPENRIPASRISPEARSLLGLYPLPNFASSDRYNFQVPVVSGNHQDDLQARINKQVRRNFFAGSLAWQSTRTDNPGLFGYLETKAVSGLNTALNYRRALTPRSFLNFGVQYSYYSTSATPYFANLRNVSAEAGIHGNNQEPQNWGPPALTFSSGISPLRLSQHARNRNQTGGASVDGFSIRGRNYIAYGYTFRRQQFNIRSQEDARGTLTFTGEQTGYDLAAFLLGLPDTSSIAFGNADKYLRGSIHESFLNDDWRVNPSLTVNAGVRWEYWSPLHEKYGRLVNLEVTPGFSSATPGTNIPRPDRNNVSPRIGFAWRPFPASSLVVRGGYGIYYDTSVYQPIATRMSQQAPFSRSLRVANSSDTPLSLSNPFPFDTAGAQATTFGVDPDFRIGYSQNWQLSLQRDLPAALQMSLRYNGSKGTRAQQLFLPNTYPDHSVAPSGFTWLASNGNSTRHAAEIQLRRRLRSGISASASYTYARAIDNGSVGGRNEATPFVAQNWLDLGSERASSNFDQRHLLDVSAAYTTGMGAGGALSSGRLAGLVRDWTISTQIKAGSGLPLTPIVPSPVAGTGVSGTVRPDYTGADPYAAPAGLQLNPAAFAVAPTSRWGNAGRNSLTGPRQFVLNASVSRTLRSSERMSYDLRFEALNALNTVTYPSWVTVVGSSQFGLPSSANPMRTVQIVFRTRF